MLDLFACGTYRSKADCSKCGAVYRITAWHPNKSALVESMCCVCGHTYYLGDPEQATVNVAAPQVTPD